MNAELSKNLVGRHARREHRQQDTYAITPSTFTDLLLPPALDELGPGVTEIPPMKVTVVRKMAHQHRAAHVRHMEELSERFRQAGRITAQLRCLGMLCSTSIKGKDRGLHLGAYYRALEEMRERLRRWEHNPDNPPGGRHAWREVEQRVVALLMDLDARVDVKRRGKYRPKRKTLTLAVPAPKRTPIRKPPVAAPVAPPPRAPEPIPEPIAAAPAIDYERLSDDELAALIPEEER